MNDSWIEYALCRQTDTELFFPEPGSTARDAKRTCMACEVRTQCLDYALDTGQTHGVWGGLSESELRELRKARTAPTAA